jgi:hypothetical protein
MIKSTIVITLLLISPLLFSQEKGTSFTLCDSISVRPYYYPKLTYQGGFWEIKQHFNSTYPTDEFKALKNNSGIITVQFKVNCNGEIGDFKIQQCDLNYQLITLNKKITSYFLTKTKLLKNWIPAKDEDGNTVNSHKFFSFRLKDGVLLEILPK